jgi:hypothetical protein
MLHTNTTEVAASMVTDTYVVPAASINRADADEAQAIEMFRTRITEYPLGVTVDQIMHDAEQVEKEVYGDYPYSGAAPRLFQIFGRELLPRVIPEIQTMQGFLDPEGQATEVDRLIETDLIQGQRLEKIVTRIGDTMIEFTQQSRAEGCTDPAELVSGMCDYASKNVIRGLGGLAAELEPVSKLVRVDWTASKLISDDPKPKLTILGEGHSIVGIGIGGAETDPESYLMVDPTVAQADEFSLEVPDLEFNLIPAKRLEDFVRLRYRAFPTARVGVHTVAPAE